MKTSLILATVETETDLILAMQDDMTDDTYSEWFRGQGEVRDIDTMRNRALLAERFGLVPA